MTMYCTHRQQLHGAQLAQVADQNRVVQLQWHAVRQPAATRLLRLLCPALLRCRGLRTAGLPGCGACWFGSLLLRRWDGCW